MTIPKTLRPLTVRDYRLLFLGAVVSNAGSFMQNVAVQWLVYQQTGSVAWVGLVAFAQFIPLLFGAPFGGVLADRHDRRTLLLAAQTLMMASSGALTTLTLLDLATPSLVLATVFALGVGSALHGPSWQATVPHLVPRPLLTSAIALNSAQLSLGRIAGPALGGALLVAAGPAAVFGLNALSYLAIIAAVWRVRLPARERRDDAPVLAHLRQGVRYAAADRTIRWLLVGVLVVSVLAAPLVTLLPAYADLLGGGPATLGLLTAALGAGSLLGSVALAQFGDRLRVDRLVGGGLTLLGAAMAVVAVAPSAAPAAAAVGVTGLLRFGTVAASNSCIQRRVDERYRGRVMSLFLVTFGGGFPIGSLLVGAAAELWGVQPATFALAAGTVAGGAVVITGLRRQAGERTRSDAVLAAA